MKLLPCFVQLLSRWNKSFADHRTQRRAIGFALAFWVSLGRRTISRAICAQPRQFQAWSPDYKFFSESRWDPHSLLDAVLDEAHPLRGEKQPLGVAFDDTIARKTGKKIPGAKWLRDPLSPPFHTNLVWSLRFLQAALWLWPAKAAGAARAVPIALQLAPAVLRPKAPKQLKKPAPAAEKKDWKQALRDYPKACQPYRQKQKQEGLSAQGAGLLANLRARFDQRPTLVNKILWAVVDASFCHRTGLAAAARAHRSDRSNSQRYPALCPARPAQGPGQKKGQRQKQEVRPSPADPRAIAPRRLGPRAALPDFCGGKTTPASL